jgi:DNA-binding NtrC family response regulator
MSKRREDETLVLASVAQSARGQLVVTGPDGREQRVPLRTKIRLGSGSGVEVVVDDPHASRVHCEVEPMETGIVLRDLGSTNGTYVGGAVVKEALITPGTVVTFGTSRLVVEVEAEAGAETATFGDAVAAGANMRAVFAMLARLAPTDVTILVTGETGVGKDVLARAIHKSSPRADGQLVVFDGGAVSPSLIESELFGHERGAFTGAHAERAGAFERADGGTLFLDEIGELPLDLQPRLLRALEQRAVRRIGGSAEMPVDVRVIAATNRDLGAEVAAGRFRQDLFFRLSAAVVHVPPLRERPEDLSVLIDRLIADTGRECRVSGPAVAALRAYDWPGNIRELKNVITTALAMVDGPLLEMRHLMFPGSARRQPSLDDLPLGGRTLDAVERAAIRQTLEQVGGNRSKAARALGIAPSTLYEKIKRYGL